MLHQLQMLSKQWKVSTWVEHITTIVAFLIMTTKHAFLKVNQLEILKRWNASLVKRQYSWNNKFLGNDSVLLNKSYFFYMHDMVFFL